MNSRAMRSINTKQLIQDKTVNENKVRNYLSALNQVLVLASLALGLPTFALW